MTKATNYQTLKEGIQKILLKYFDTTDAGESSPLWDEDYTAQEAIDDIHELVGEI